MLHSFGFICYRFKVDKFVWVRKENYAKEQEIWAALQTKYSREIMKGEKRVKGSN